MKHPRSYYEKHFPLWPGKHELPASQHFDAMVKFMDRYSVVPSGHRCDPRSLWGFRSFGGLSPGRVFDHVDMWHVVGTPSYRADFLTTFPYQEPEYIRDELEAICDRWHLCYEIGTIPQLYPETGSLPILLFRDEARGKPLSDRQLKEQETRQRLAEIRAQLKKS